MLYVFLLDWRSFILWFWNCRKRCRKMTIPEPPQEWEMRLVSFPFLARAMFVYPRSFQQPWVTLSPATAVGQNARGLGPSAPSRVAFYLGNPPLQDISGGFPGRWIKSRFDSSGADTRSWRKKSRNITPLEHEPLVPSSIRCPFWFKFPTKNWVHPQEAFPKYLY